MDIYYNVLCQNDLSCTIRKNMTKENFESFNFETALDHIKTEMTGAVNKYFIFFNLF